MKVKLNFLPSYKEKRRWIKEENTEKRRGETRHEEVKNKENKENKRWRRRRRRKRWRRRSRRRHYKKKIFN